MEFQVALLSSLKYLCPIKEKSRLFAINSPGRFLGNCCDCLQSSNCHLRSFEQKDHPSWSYWLFMLCHGGVGRVGDPHLSTLFPLPRVVCHSALDRKGGAWLCHYREVTGHLHPCWIKAFQVRSVWGTRDGGTIHTPVYNSSPMCCKASQYTHWFQSELGQTCPSVCHWELRYCVGFSLGRNFSSRSSDMWPAQNYPSFPAKWNHSSVSHKLICQCNMINLIVNFFKT